MKTLLALAALATLPFSPVSATQTGDEEASAQDQEYLGYFAGSYRCKDGEHGLFLELAVDDRDDEVVQLSGVLGIVPTIGGALEQSGMVAGSFEVSGTLVRDGMKLTLAPGDWIVQPENYGAASLEGTIRKRPDGLMQIIGKPVVAGNPDYCDALVATQIMFGDEAYAEDDGDAAKESED